MICTEISMKDKNHWVFDMDGTLTLAVHDFEVIRAELGLAPGTLILEALAAMPEDEARQMDKKLYELELDLAKEATAQPGAHQLLETLSGQGKQLGVLTRNSEPLAHVTLQAAGLDHFFAGECVVGRERCAPKPDPAGIHLLLEYWNAEPQDAIVIGDYLFDLQVGRNAGATTIHFDTSGQFSWPELTDVKVTTLDELSQHLLGIEA